MTTERPVKGKSILDNLLFSWGCLLVLILIVIALWLWLPGYLRKANASLPYGDSFDALSALFTGLAFAGLLFTIFLQQRQIKLQREDFHSQLEEMQLSRGEVAEQVKVQKNLLALGLAELKIKPLQVEIEEVQLRVRGMLGIDLLGDIRQRMDSLISDLRNNCASL